MQNNVTACQKAKCFFTHTSIDVDTFVGTMYTIQRTHAKQRQGMLPTGVIHCITLLTLSITAHHIQDLKSHLLLLLQLYSCQKPAAGVCGGHYQTELLKQWQTSHGTCE